MKPLRRASLLAGVIVATSIAVPSKSAPNAPLREAPRLDSVLENSSRHLDIDSAGRRLFEIGRPRGGDAMSVVTYDLDTLRRLRIETIDDAHSGEGGRLSAVDAVRHRLFVLYPIPATPVPVPSELVRSELRITAGIAIFDTLTGRLATARQISLVVPGIAQDRSAGNGAGFKAMSYFGARDEQKLYLVTEVPSGLNQFTASNHSVFVHELDVGRLVDGSANPVSWTTPLPSCGMTMSGEYQQPSSLLRRRTPQPELWIPCRGGTLLTVQQPAETAGLVRLRWEAASDRAKDFHSEFFPITGDLRTGVVNVDPTTERFFLQSSGLTGENSVWIFDAPAASWLGAIVVPMASITTLAVDASIGRLYILTSISREGEGTLMEAVVASTRSLRADQGQYIAFPSERGINFARAVVDPVRRRVFAVETDAVKVISDSLPRPAAQAVFDPDSATIDVAESSDTAVNFLGSGAAFGSRLRWIGGPRGVERNLNPFGDIDIFLGTGSLLPALPAPGTRDLHFARVRHATLTNEEASASAAGGERDTETDTDLGNWTSYLQRWGGPDLTGQRWPYRASQCTDFGGGDDAREASALGAVARCSRANGTSSASAASDFGLGHPGFSIGESRADVVARRDPKRGIVVRSTAEVIGIDFGGRAGIGRIYSVAESWATGRPKRSNKVGAGSSWNRLIENVWIRTPENERRVLCTVECDVRRIGPELNGALGARLRFDFPEPDPLRRAGTPGGYEALVMAPLSQQANDAAINEETGIRLEVPAMIVTGFTDGRVASRVIASFGGVSAESHYGIYRLADLVGPGPVAPPPEGPGPVVPDIPLGPEQPTVPQPAQLPPIIREVVTGFRFLVTSPAQSARALGLWLFLSVPVVLLLRRRAVRS